MGKPIVVNQDGLRCLIDPDDPNRKPAEIITYKLSPEEIEARYGKIKKPSNRLIGGFDGNKVKETRQKEAETMHMKATKEQLTEECRQLGFSKESYKEIAKKYGFSSYQTVATLIRKYGIKKIIEVESLVKSHKEFPAEEQEVIPIVEAKKSEVHDDSISSDEFELLSKVRDILNENNKLKSAADELKCVVEKNIAIKEFLVQLKTNIEELVELIS